MEPTFDEITDISDIIYFPSGRTSYTLAAGIYEISDIKKTLKNLLPDIVKVSITIDDFRLKSQLSISQTSIFTKKSFFIPFLWFTQSHSGPLDDLQGFILLIPGSYKSEKLINTTGIDKIHLKCDCINGSFVNRLRENFVYFCSR